MNIHYTSINTGSNGNCFYIGNAGEAILVDVGIRKSVLLSRMESLGLSMNEIKGIFITHEHSDHIFGLRTLLNEFSIPIYTTPECYQQIRHLMPEELFRPIAANDQIAFQQFRVKSFAKQHDAANPFSIVVETGSGNIGVITDCGMLCHSLVNHFQQCQVVFLESNYCPEMLDNGRYPKFLKHRIKGGLGHLSNRQAKELVISHRHPQLQHLILSHLSGNNNRPQLVSDTFSGFESDFKVTVASRDINTDLFVLGEITVRKQTLRVEAPQQLGLWE
jgi:phosphoribosyl 1,2-cyclic phosphodiesterase